MEGAFELVDTYNTKVVIKIISMSNSSDDAVRNMEKQIDGVEFIYSDAIENNREILSDTDMVFLIGVTSEAGIQAIAEIALEYDVLMIAVVTTPLALEIDKNLNVTEFLCSSNALLESIKGITDTVVNPGMINVDLDDIRVILLGKNKAIMSTSSASGEDRAREATQQAMNSPLFKNVDLKMVRSILVNIAASEMGLAEFNDVGDVVSKKLSDNARIKIGMSINEKLGDVIEISVVVAGF